MNTINRKPLVVDTMANINTSDTTAEDTVLYNTFDVLNITRTADPPNPSDAAINSGASTKGATFENASTG